MVQQLPYGTNPATSLVVADYKTIKLKSNASPQAGGSCICWSDVVDPGLDYAWLITNMVVQNTSTTITNLSLSIGVTQGDVDVADLAGGSSAGNLDFDDVPAPGLLVQAGEAITFLWTNCSAGAIGRARVQITKLRQS